MNRHGQNREGICTISAKVDLELREKLDEIRNKLNLKTRSEVIRLAIKSYMSKQ